MTDNENPRYNTDFRPLVILFLRACHHLLQRFQYTRKSPEPYHVSISQRFLLTTRSFRLSDSRFRQTEGCSYLFLAMCSETPASEKAEALFRAYVR